MPALTLSYGSRVGPRRSTRLHNKGGACPRPRSGVLRRSRGDAVPRTSTRLRACRTSVSDVLRKGPPTSRRGATGSRTMDGALSLATTRSAGTPRRRCMAKLRPSGGYSEQLAAARLAERDRRKGSSAGRTDPSDLIPNCPLCGKSMVLRTAQSGRNAGKQCLGAEPVPDHVQAFCDGHAATPSREVPPVFGRVGRPCRTFFAKVHPPPGEAPRAHERWMGRYPWPRPGAPVGPIRPISSPTALSAARAWSCEPRRVAEMPANSVLGRSLQR